MPGSWSDFLKLRSGPAPPPSSEAGAVRVYADANGALRSVQSDGTDAAIGGGGGGSMTVTREQIQGNTANIANGGTAPLPWNIVSSGDPLLDLTTPTAPSVVDAGVYAVSVQVNAEDVMTADGVFSASLALDNSGDFAGMSGVSNAAYAGFTKPYLALSLTYYIPAGGTIVVTVGNFDGANAIHFDLFGIVQRLS